MTSRWIARIIHKPVSVLHNMNVERSCGYLTQGAAQISRNALASGLCGDYSNRGLAPSG